MKKIIRFITITTLAMAGCGLGVKGDYSYLVHYVYVNESSSEITVRSVIPMEKIDDIEHTFTLPVNDRCTISLHSDYYPRPFCCGSQKDYLTVSNGTKTVTQRYRYLDELYVEDNYTLISEEHRVKTMQYVFTDKFFNEEEPIE